MPFIQTIDYPNSAGELRRAYDQITGSRGKLAEVHKIQSLNPEAMLAHMDFYKAIMFARSPLKRYQREMMAVIVSAANQCDYCIEHHKEALLFYWKDQEKVDHLLAVREEAGLTEIDRALCWFAEAVTLNPGDIAGSEIEKLRSLGLPDRAILDATQIIAYFNFVNRMVLALGVEFNEEEKKGYKY